MRCIDNKKVIENATISKINRAEASDNEHI